MKDAIYLSLGVGYIVQAIIMQSYLHKGLFDNQPFHKIGMWIFSIGIGSLGTALLYAEFFEYKEWAYIMADVGIFAGLAVIMFQHSRWRRST